MAAVTAAGATHGANIVYGGDSAAGVNPGAAHVTVNTTWTSDNVYYLTDPVFVKDGATLTIQPGTVIRGTMASGAGDFPGALVVSRGSKLNAVGTPTQPIIMTGEADNNVPGMVATTPWNDDENGLTQQWGGLIILGRAFLATNVGGDDDDSSGEIKFVQIRYGGFVLGEANEINGLTLGAVGRGTKISFVEITNNKDDGVEFFGSTVNTKYMIVRNSADDSFDWDEGYRGKGQFWLVIQGSLHTTSDSSDKGSECDGGMGDASQPSSCPTIYNATYIGLGRNIAANGKNTAFNFRDGTAGRVYNSMFLDFGGAIAIIEGATTGAGTSAQKTTMTYPQNQYYDHEANGSKMLELKGNYFANFGTPTIPGWPANSENIGGQYGTDGTGGNKAAFAYPLFTGLGNLYENVSLDPMSYNAPLYFERSSTALAGAGKSVYNVTYIDGYIPAADMPSGVTLKSVPANDGFFSDVPFPGAFGSDPNANWLLDWTLMDRLGMVASEYDASTVYSFGDFETLRADPPLEITDFYQSMTLRFFAGEGKSYRIEASTEAGFADPNLISTVDTIAGNGAYITYNDMQRIEGNKFYRIVEVAE